MKNFVKICIYINEEEESITESAIELWVQRMLATEIFTHFHPQSNGMRARAHTHTHTHYWFFTKWCGSCAMQDSQDIIIRLCTIAKVTNIA